MTTLRLASGVAVAGTRSPAGVTAAMSDELATQLVAVGDLDELAVQIRELHDTCDSVRVAPRSNQGTRQAAMPVLD